MNRTGPCAEKRLMPAVRRRASAVRASAAAPVAATTATSAATPATPTAVAAARCGVRARRSRIAAAWCGIGPRLRRSPIAVVWRASIGALWGTVRAPVVGSAWTAAIIIWSRRPRSLAVRGPGLRTPACPGWTVRICPRALRRRIRRTIRTPETRGCATAIRGISLRFPGARVVAACTLG